MKLHRMPRVHSSGQFVAGFRYVTRRPDLVIVFVIVFLIGAFGMNFPIFSSTMAVEFGRGAGEYGVLNSILAIGSLTGALLAARRERARIRIIIVASAFFGVAVLIAALMPTYWTFAASTVLIGFGAVSILTTANGYVQTTTDPELRGRVMALYMAILVGGTPIGAPIVGAVADNWGPRWALGVAAVAAGVAALIGLGWLVFARGMHLVPHPRARWRPVVRFADAPTAAIAIIPTRPVQMVHAEPASLHDPRDRGELVPSVPNDRLVAADFSEEVALTSPIAIPRTAPRRRGGAPCARAARARAWTRAPRALDHAPRIPHPRGVRGPGRSPTRRRRASARRDPHLRVRNAWTPGSRARAGTRPARA